MVAEGDVLFEDFVDGLAVVADVIDVGFVPFLGQNARVGMVIEGLLTDYNANITRAVAKMVAAVGQILEIGNDLRGVLVGD
jgi:hypothetical protein